MSHATGTFEVKLSPQTEDQGDGANLGRYALEKQFHGDLEGAGKGEMLTAGTPSGAAAYVAVERVTGTLQGRKGSFVLVHRGFSAAAELEVVVLEGSGSGELAGLTGKLGIRRVERQHFYDLEDSLPAAPQ